MGSNDDDDLGVMLCLLRLGASVLDMFTSD